MSQRGATGAAHPATMSSGLLTLHGLRGSDLMGGEGSENQAPRILGFKYLVTKPVVGI